MKDVRETQLQVLAGPLYQAVVDAEIALRHKSEYDIANADDRRFAILCWALQESANGASGTSINLAGAFRVLGNLVD